MTARPSPFVVIIIGPSGVGKSSVAEHLLLRHGLASYCVDANCFELYLGDPRFRRVARQIGATASTPGLRSVLREVASKRASDNLSYQEALHLMAVRKVLANARESVIDFGSGHGSCVIESNQAELAALLAPHPVLCLWPSRDIDRACEILSSRNRRDLAITRECLFLHNGRDVAKHVVYVEERSIAEVSEDVLIWARRHAREEVSNGPGCA